MGCGTTRDVSWENAHQATGLPLYAKISGGAFVVGGDCCLLRLDGNDTPTTGKILTMAWMGSLALNYTACDNETNATNTTFSSIPPFPGIPK